MEKLAHWIDLESIKLLTHHTSAVITAVLLTALVGFLVQRLLHDGFAKKCILWLDEFLIVGLFVWFAYELFLAL
jgi:hypothetical protein